MKIWEVLAKERHKFDKFEEFLHLSRILSSAHTLSIIIKNLFKFELFFTPPESLKKLVLNAKEPQYAPLNETKHGFEDRS